MKKIISEMTMTFHTPLPRFNPYKKDEVVKNESVAEKSSSVSSRKNSQ